MAQIFISYSTKDQAQADQAVAYLEKYGYTCFIATRDIDGGADYTACIKNQLATPNSVCLLLFSENADASTQVKLEISEAVRNERPIVPFRLTKATPQNLGYFLQLFQWVNIHPEDTYKNLIKSLGNYISPQIVFHDDDERYLVRFFKQYAIDLTPYLMFSNGNYNRYVFAIPKEQVKLFELLQISLKNNYGYFEKGRLVLENTFACLIDMDAQNCLVTVDVSKNDHTLCTCLPQDIPTNDDEFCLALGFDEDNAFCHIDMENKHLYVENADFYNTLQIEYLLRKSFLTGSLPHKLFLLEKQNPFGEVHSMGMGEVLPFDDQLADYDLKTIERKRSLLDVGYKLSKEQFTAFNKNATFINKIDSEDVDDKNEDMLFDNLVTALYKRMALFSKHGVRNIGEYCLQVEPLEHIVVVIDCDDHQNMISSKLNRTLNLMINRYRCAHYGVHFVVIEGYSARKPSLKSIFKRDTVIGHFLHEFSLDCEEGLIDKIYLKKCYADLLIDKKHIVLPFVVQEDGIYQKPLQLQKPKIAQYQVDFIRYYWLLPDLLKMIAQKGICHFDFGELYEVNGYVICDLTIQGVLSFYQKLGIVKLIGDGYCLSKSDYDDFGYNLQSM